MVDKDLSDRNTILKTEITDIKSEFVFLLSLSFLWFTTILNFQFVCQRLQAGFKDTNMNHNSTITSLIKLKFDCEYLSYFIYETRLTALFYIFDLDSWYLLFFRPKGIRQWQIN